MGITEECSGDLRGPVFSILEMLILALCTRFPVDDFLPCGFALVHMVSCDLEEEQLCPLCIGQDRVTRLLCDLTQMTQPMTVAAITLLPKLLALPL